MTCGPTALKMIAAYYGRDITEKEVLEIVGGLKKYGVATIKLAEAARKLGFKTESYSFSEKHAKGHAKIKKPDTEDILKFLKKKIPVILLVRSFILFGQKKNNDGHFIVITGHKNGKFEYNDPKDGKAHTISADELRFAWFNRVIDMSAYLIAVWQ